MQTLTRQSHPPRVHSPRRAADFDVARDGGRDIVNAVETHGLTKRYGKRAAVHDLSFHVPTGSIAGLIGPNGAGKTTLMAMLLGLVLPSEGSATVLGRSVDRPREYLGRVGASIEGPAFHPAVSGIDNLRALAVMRRSDTSELPELIDLVGLSGRQQDRYASYSLGMKQRLGIAASLLGDPEVVILDEPTNGLDPLGMQDIRRIIVDIAAGGRTVIVSSHLLSELEQVCDWLVVVDHGGLVYLGAPELLAGTDRLILRTADPADLARLRSVLTSAAIHVDPADAALIMTLTDNNDPAELAADINRRAHGAGIVLSELHHARADLEARFLDLVSTDGRLPQTSATIEGWLS